MEMTIFLLVLVVCDKSVESAFIKATKAIINRPPHAIETNDATYKNVRTSSMCSQLCMSSTLNCQALQYDMDSKICLLSTVPSILPIRNRISRTVADAIEYVGFYKRFLVDRETDTCRYRFLTQLQKVTFDECIHQHSESLSAGGEFSYNEELSACIPVLPQTPSAISCSGETNWRLYTNIYKREHTTPSKIIITGTIDSSPPYYSYYPASLAFDGLYDVHFPSAMNSENPFISGDIGALHIIAGAIFSARSGCCNENTVNLHFLVALDESDLDIPERSLCSVYPGPPEYPLLQNYEKLWLPCPLREARFFKIMIMSSSAWLNVGEFELFGY